MSRAFVVLTFVAALALGAVAACGPQSDDTSAAARGVNDTDSVDAASQESSPMPPEGRPELLSEWGQLNLDDGRLTLADGVEPYTLNSILFSDYAHKLRTVWLPPGSRAAIYHAEDVFDFPVGTVITKTFWYDSDGGAGPNDNQIGDQNRVVKVVNSRRALDESLDLAKVRLVETRILVHRQDGWEALPYVWNAEQTEATLMRTGDLQQLTIVDGDTETDFPYAVPNVNQCGSCHTIDHAGSDIAPIGPKARHLHRDIAIGDDSVSQLERWQAIGLVADLPDTNDIPRAAVWDDDSAGIQARALAYLDINCAHCHNSKGPADTSGLFLEASADMGTSYGICKPPIAAGTGTGGRFVGISPGQPEESIFVFRMESTDPGSMMPELGRALRHDEGVELISAWIDTLDGSC